MSLKNIIMKRDCGLLRVQSIKSYGYGLEKVMSIFGLRSNKDAMRQINMSVAEDIIEAILWKDLAYHTEIMKRDDARFYAKKILNELSDSEAVFYTNGNWESYHQSQSFSWTPVTGATFDAGVLILHQDYVSLIWVDDED